MKYTRLEISNRLLKKEHKTFIYFFIIIPLFSIILGAIFVNVITKHNMQNVREKIMSGINAAKTESKTPYKKINSIYFLQVGAFTNKANADMVIKSIKDKGFYPCTVKDKDVYRIIIEVSNNKDELLKISHQLKELGYSCIIHEQKFNIQNNEYIDTVKEILGVQLDINLRLKSGKEVEKTILNNYLIKIKNNRSDFNLKFFEILEKYSAAVDKKDLLTCKKAIIEEIIFINNNLM